MTRRRGSGTLVAAVLAGLVIGLLGVLVRPAGPARAHAVLDSSDPPANSRLVTSPTDVTLRFSEPVSFVPGSLRVVDATGTTVPGVGQPTHTDGEASMGAALPELAPGGYLIVWKVVSADSHPAEGAFPIVIGDGTAPDAAVLAGVEGPGGNRTAGDVLDALRSAGYLGLMVALGLWAFVLFVDPLGRRDLVLRIGASIGGAILTLSSIGRIPAQARYVGTGWTNVADQTAGRAWLVLAGVGILLGLVPLLWPHVTGLPARVVPLGAVAVVAGLAVAYGGHGASGRAAALGIAVTVVHIVAASAWVGGLVGLLRRWWVTERVARWRVAARFSSLALVASSLVILTGTVQSVRQPGSFSALTGSSFGRTLLIKLGIVALLLVLAAISRFSASLHRRLLGDSLIGEINAAALILGVTGFLAGASPVDAQHSVAAHPVSVTATNGNRIAYVDLTPGLAGPNEIHVTVSSPGGALENPDEITAEIASADGEVGPTPLDAQPAGAGHVIAKDALFTFPGGWTVTVHARYGEFTSVTFTATVTISP